jgi:hypothetical protein
MQSPRAPFVIRSSALVFAALLGAAAAGPAAAQSGDPTLVTLSWMQPAGSAPVSQFRVYTGTLPFQGSVLYAGLPVPNAQGVYSTTVQIDEIAQGIPMYVWLTAANASGESAPSNANLYPEGCDPSVDSDCDGIPDEGALGKVPCATGQSLNCDDNCRYWPNPGQEDTGGIGVAVPDGIGNACQCGDVTGDGRVALGDYIIMRRALAVPPLATMAHPELCDVGGSVGCTNTDSIIVMRALQVPPTATIQQQCDPSLAP